MRHITYRLEVLLDGSGGAISPSPDHKQGYSVMWGAGSEAIRSAGLPLQRGTRRVMTGLFGGLGSGMSWRKPRKKVSPRRGPAKRKR